MAGPTQPATLQNACSLVGPLVISGKVSSGTWETSQLPPQDGVCFFKNTAEIKAPKLWGFCQYKWAAEQTQK